MVAGFQRWAEWFKKTPGFQMPISWDNDICLNSKDKKAIGRSIAMFKKGESSDGRIFLEKAMNATNHNEDQSYVEALRHFILEENRHSSLLGRFMNNQQIPELKHHWVDDIFRQIRKPGGLELSIRVLVTAEIMAVPYYTALSAATVSPVLKAICRQILSDEFMHLKFQADALSAMVHNHSTIRNLMSNSIHRLFLEQTACVVWAHHRKVFRRGGYSFFRFRNECIFLWYKVSQFLHANPNCTVPSVDPSHFSLTIRDNEHDASNVFGRAKRSAL